MPTTSNTADQYKLFTLCKETVKVKKIKDPETNTFVSDVTLPTTVSGERVIIETIDSYTSKRVFNLLYDAITSRYTDSVYRKIEDKNLLKIQVVKNGRGVVHIQTKIKKVNLDKLYKFCENNISKEENIIFKRRDTVSIKPKDIDNGRKLYNTISAQLTDMYPDVVFKNTEDGDLFKIRAIINGSGSIHIAKKKGKVSRALKPGLAYEDYFESVIIDGIQSVNEWVRKMDWPSQFRPSLTLKLTSNNNMITISPIAGVSGVGGENNKTDIRIYRPNTSCINISLKQTNFFSWSSADTYNPRFSKNAKALLEQAISKKLVTVENEQIIFPKGVKGIRAKVTDDEEMKYYAFGTGVDQVNYIVIGAGLDGIDEDDHIIYMTGKETYRYNNTQDMARLEEDFYIVIYKNVGREGKNRSSSALSPYKNVSVRYVNRSHAYSSDVYTRESYIDI